MTGTHPIHIIGLITHTGAGTPTTTAITITATADTTAITRGIQATAIHRTTTVMMTSQLRQAAGAVTAHCPEVRQVPQAPEANQVTHLPGIWTADVCPRQQNHHPPQVLHPSEPGEPDRKQVR